MSNTQKHHNNNDSNQTRIALLEQSIGHIDQTLMRIDNRIDKMEKDAKSDFRWLLGIIIGGNAGLFALLAHGFKWF